MIILSDSNNVVVGSFLNGTKITNITEQNLPISTEQFGKNAILVIDPTTNELAYNYVDRPLTESEKITQSEQEQAAMLLALVNGGLM
jgi:hypothetical protein